MIARLLGDFEIDLGELSKSTAIATRRMLGGTLSISIFSCAEPLERLEVDRFLSLISNFKMATAKLVACGELYV